MHRFATACAASLSLFCLWPQGQTGKVPPPGQQPAGQEQSQPKADPKDVASTASITAALYDVISGPADKARDWNRMRSLFHPDARLVPMLKGKDGGMHAVVLTVEDYVRRAGPHLEKDGFFEQEVAQRHEEFGDMAHVWTTYEARHGKADAEPFLRGINSIQLVHQHERWFVLQIVWEQAQDAGPIPQDYLPGK
jgi:hypothetical protein